MFAQATTACPACSGACSVGSSSSNSLAIGLGVGLGVGIPVVTGIAAAVYFARKAPAAAVSRDMPSKGAGARV